MTLLSAPTYYQEAFPIAPAASSDWPARGARLSVLTYNIKGLPWPVADDRSSAISAIGQRLRLMRSRGIQPHIVLLQEAFMGQAKQLARVAGYDFVALGPTAAGPDVQSPLGRKFDADAQWVKGERSGSLVDSGLMVLSDYPVTRTRRYAFPEGACAGYDCLAAKGVLVAWLDVPGAAGPVAVVDTHLNSRHSTHVRSARADTAYAWQVSALRHFLAREVSPDTPVIFGGDFNIGNVSSRRSAISAAPLLGAAQVDGLAESYAEGHVPTASIAEAQQILSRNKDRIISRSGKDIELSPFRSWVPFKLSTTDHPMSDHAGFVVDYHFAKLRS